MWDWNNPPETILKVRGLKVISHDAIDPMESDRDTAILKAFGERLRELRKEKGFSQEALALACGLDRTYIGGIERGERNVSLLNIHKIALSLDVACTDLFVPQKKGARRG